MISFVDLSSIANFLKIFIETIETVTSISDSMKSHLFTASTLAGMPCHLLAFLLETQSMDF